jgi:hypothetical protein
MILMEFDKAGAEWVCVAYLSGDVRMIDVVKRGVSPHIVTGSLITRIPEDVVEKESKIVKMASDPDYVRELRLEHFPELLDQEADGLIYLPRSMSIRQAGKKSNHALNYGERYKTFALQNEIPESEAKIIVDLYTTQAYTGIPLWWEAVRDQLRKNRTLTSLLGHKIEFQQEWGEDLFRAAYSFDPQSTVGDMVNDALIAFDLDHRPHMYKAEVLTQTHDSATLQYPDNSWSDCARFAIDFDKHMSPELESKGRKFTIKTDLKVGYDWGHMIELKLTHNVKELADAIKEACKRLRH